MQQGGNGHSRLFSTICLTANLIKLAPTGALTFLGVETVKDVMGWR